ncbi:hypothetical protein ACJZ2D_011154 [Fusarium nematophilum]
MAGKKVFITGATGFIGGDAFYALYEAEPGWVYTLLARSEEKGKEIQAKYPGVKVVVGSLDDSQVIERAASEADIVIHTADSSDHRVAAEAIGAGLRSSRSTSNPGYWIHISGTGILCWYDMDNQRYGEAPLPSQAYNDLGGVDRVTSLPDTAFHRDVDKIVLGEAAADPDAVKVAVVCPPTIYGTGRGPVNQRSQNGTHKWSDIAKLVSSEAHKQGFVSQAETKSLDAKEAKEKLGFEALSWGLNSRGQAERARKYLGWKPDSPSLEETIPDVLKLEAQRLGLSSK